MDKQENLVKKVLVTGAGGQLGQELYQTCPKDIELIALDRRLLDICDLESVRKTIHKLEPFAVINAAAFTGVDQAETDLTAAERVNACGPSYLAKACRESKSWLLHVSTDFVFDGRDGVPYKPRSKPSPLGVYGQTKLRGEENILRSLPSSLIVRTSWVYSACGSNFVKTMLGLLKSRQIVNVVEDQVGGPTWARGLAEMLWTAMKQENLHGIYHWSDSGECSWYEFAVAIAQEASAIGLIDRCAEVRPILSRDYKTKAKRPSYSVLDYSSTCLDIGIHPLPWRDQLRAMLTDYQGKACG